MTRSLKPRSVALALVAVGLGVAAYEISIPLRASAQKTHCQNNLKQIGLATMQYNRDYDEKYMLAPKWKSELKPYLAGHRAGSVKHLLTCLTTEREYAFNARLEGASLAQVNTPQTMTLFYEPSRAMNADDGKSWPVNGIHAEGSNVGFADGHVKWLTAKPAFWAPGLPAKNLKLRGRHKGTPPTAKASRASQEPKR